MIKIINHFTKLLLLFVILFTIQTIKGQEQDDSEWQLKGFVDTYHAVRLEKPKDFMSSRTRIRGEIGKSFKYSSIFVSFNAIYNSLLKEHTDFEFREAYIDHRDDYWGFRIGRQLVIWGIADGIRITDLVSPMDLTEFLAQDYDDIRMPVNALRFFVFNDKMKLELLAVPTFEAYKLPTDPANPWSIFNKDYNIPIVWSEDKNTPKLNLSNIEYGGRLLFTFPGIDFSISALNTWNKMPIISYLQSDENIKISPHYYRMLFLGADISKPLGEFVLRGEMAFNIGKHFSYNTMTNILGQKGFNTLNYLVGLDWYAPCEWKLMIQFSSESIFGYESYISQPQHNSLLTFSISKKLLESTLQLSNFTYFDINNNGWFSRFGADYTLNDYISISAGLDWFGGNKGIFNTYKHNSEIWAKVKYSF